jgi:hypothetical protein
LIHATLLGELNFKKVKARFNIHDAAIRDSYKQQDQSGGIISRHILSGETLSLRVEYGSYFKHYKHVLCRMVVYGAKFINRSNFYLTNLLTLYQRRGFSLLILDGGRFC